MCMLSTEARRSAASPSPLRLLPGWVLLRTSFSEKEIDYKRLLEPSGGDSWRLYMDETKGQFFLTFKRQLLGKKGQTAQCSFSQGHRAEERKRQGQWLKQ